MTTWVPEACTLPTAARPRRLAEFDDLFRTAPPQRPAPTRLRWVLDPAAEQTARDLAARESVCCSFFTFTITGGADGVIMEVSVPPAYVEVLDALAARSAAA